MSLNRTGLLDTKSRRFAQTTLFLLVFCLASVLRLLVLDDRPFHNDEGVNYFFIQGMFRDGFYKYSHENYHGPSYFYLTFLFESLIGQNEYGHRMSAVVSSLGVVLCPLLLGSLVSFRSKLYATILLALSSSGIYYGRYAIHESFLVFVSLSFSIYLFKWLETRQRSDLVWIGFYLGLLISTKETFIIHFFATGLSALLLFGPLRIFTQLGRHYSHFLVGLLICLTVISLLFSGFFRHPDGLRELLFGIQQWVGRGHSDTGHHKPFDYYYKVLETTEPVAIAGLLPVLYFLIYSFYRLIRNNGWYISKVSWQSLLALRGKLIEPLANIEIRFALFMFLTALINFRVYSHVPYKTPWLIINLSAPSLLGLGVFLGSAYSNSRQGKVWKSYFNLGICSSILCFILVFVSGLYALRYNFRESFLGIFAKYVDPQGVYGDRNPFAYVHAFDEMVELGKDIDSYMEKSPDSKILIGTKSYWPLPFYLRKHEGKLGYINGVTKAGDYKNQYQILILDPGVRLEDEGWDFRFYHMSDNQSANVFFKKFS